MTKVYNNKSNAIRAFKTHFPDTAAGLDNAAIAADWLDEDDGGYVLIDPATVGEENDFEAGVEEELAQRKAIAAQADAEAEAQHPMMRSQALERHNTDLPKLGRDGKCPHCGIHLDSYGVTEFHEMSPGSQRDTDQQFTCNECAGEWGPVVNKPKTARKPSGSSNGLKIESNRETRNGVTRPSIGGKCRGVWDMLDALGLDVTAKEAKAAAEGKFDKTTTMVQFYRWRKFNGISGRQ